MGDNKIVRTEIIHDGNELVKVHVTQDENYSFKYYVEKWCSGTNRMAIYHLPNTKYYELVSKDS